MTTKNAVSVKLFLTFVKIFQIYLLKRNRKQQQQMNNFNRSDDMNLAEEIKEWEREREHEYIEPESVDV